jgi:ATP-dependent Zn protease
MPDERRGLSYHEAGHAVVAWALGFRVIKVSIGMDGDDGPVTELDPVNPPTPSQALIINRGGMAAEDLFEAPTSPRAHFFDRYDADQKILKRLKRKKCEAKRVAYDRARELLEANKEMAIGVAEHLIKHGKIDGAEFERLAESSGQPA